MSLSSYRGRLGLQQADIIPIEHEDAMVADVFRITEPDHPNLILKVCSREKDFFREAYFLGYFADKIPVPHIVQLIKPEEDVHGAILMECLPGALLKPKDADNTLAYKIGKVLAHIHLERMSGYGDILDPKHLSQDPRIPFTMKFEEGVEECKGRLPDSLLEKCRAYFDQHVDLLASVDGPCIVHRDFRPGNLIVSEGIIQGVIDWSSARSGFAEEDFYSLEFDEWTTLLKCKNAFLQGYASVRSVPDYKRVAPLLRLSRIIGALGFTVKRGTWNLKHASFYERSLSILHALLI